MKVGDRVWNTFDLESRGKRRLGVITAIDTELWPYEVTFYNSPGYKTGRFYEHELIPLEPFELLVEELLGEEK